jgi:hypothetical protein
LSQVAATQSILTKVCRRLKDNFSIIKEEDRSRLLEAKDKVEKEFNEMKWTLIAETIKQEGGDLYTVSCTPSRLPTHKIGLANPF